MRVLLTGAAGLIGQVSTRLLHERGHQVLAGDLQPLPSDCAQVPWRRLDVRRGEQVRATLQDFRPHAVVHLAARHFIPWCERYPAATLQTNVVGSQNVIEGLLRAGGAKLVFASSAAVYGRSPRPLPESSALGPEDVYGTSKSMGEQLVQLAQQRTEGFDAVVLRLFNTIGPGDRNPHLIPRLVGQLRRGGGGPVRLGNLRSVRDYVHAEDVARAIVAAVERELRGLTVVNVGSGSGRSVEEVVQTLAQLVGRELLVVSVAERRRAVDRPFLVADVQRARRLLGWEPIVSFAEGLADVLRADVLRDGDGAPAELVAV